MYAPGQSLGDCPFSERGEGLADRVFDFQAEAATELAPQEPVCTYTTFRSDAPVPDTEHPILVLRNPYMGLKHHLTGTFRNPKKRSCFDYMYSGGAAGQPDDAKELSADILKIDLRFEKLIRWLGDNHVTVRLSGWSVRDGYAVYRIMAVNPRLNPDRPDHNDAFLQMCIRRLSESRAPEETAAEHDEALSRADEDERLHITDLDGMVHFLECAGTSLPREIERWAFRNIALIRSGAISPEEKRHAQRSLSMMLNIRWKSTYFPPIDPGEARRILDESLYGMERVKQRVIETIIQINRTHTLPAYGLLLSGPAGTGKSQIAYAVARILGLPWTSLDMSAIHDSEALTGSPRVYSNAKPGRIMEAFSQAGSSNLVFIINELDKADRRSINGNPADALLTLLDNLGYTDNYVECMIPTGGVYPIATANDKSRISEPLMTRFAVIDIPDYTPEEKKIIFTDFALPKVLRHMGMRPEECVVLPEGVEEVIRKCAGSPGVRDLEQAAEHLAANALFRIETEGLRQVVFDGASVHRLLYNNLPDTTSETDMRRRETV